MNIPRPGEDSKKFFKSILPDDSRVSVRLVFGNDAAFVNGNMFVGLWGNDLFLRLSDDDRKELLKKEGATNFEPMKGRPMKGYTLIPRTWKTQPQVLRRWVTRSLDWASELPAKKAKR
ncbi:MAG TPA: TfoX/Sxy family protein [Nitrososphaerales archaeon]|nr:TfoX/Sxy family protein [Nitrososphaerales archaeon]